MTFPAWLAHLPEAWGTTTVARLASQTPRSFTDGDWVESPFITHHGVRLIQTGNVGTGYYREQGFRYISDESFKTLRCTEVLAGDLLICRLGDPVARSCIAPNLGVRMITSVDVCILRPGPHVDVRFANYALNSLGNLDYVASLVRGSTRDRVSRSMLGKFLLPEPPLDVQRAIADFLDRETAQIDAFIAKSEELITLLTERRVTEIDRSVGWGQGTSTSGEWLGQVPPGWTLAPFRRWIRFMTSGSRGWGQFYSDSGEDIFLRIGDLQRDRLELRDVERQRVDLPEGEEGVRAKTEPGDLLVSITADLGSVAVIGDGDAGAFVSQHVALVRIDSERLLPRFAAYGIASSAGKSHFEQAAYGGTKIQLSLPDVKELHLAVPSIREQLRIVEHLDRTTEEVDASVNAARRAIDLARERRAALISAAVTGRIDVGVSA